MNVMCKIKIGVTVLALAAMSSPAWAGGAAASGQSGAAMPAALRPALYKALAKDAGTRYAVNGKGCARLAKSGLKVCFGRDGARFSGAGAPLALHLAAYGRGDTLTAVQSVEPAIQGNEVSYAHGNLTGWWRVLPIGFEQGFTIAKRLVGQGELTLALAMSRQDVDASDKGAVAWGKLRYGKLVVTDANGKVVPATLRTQGDRILIAVNDTHAAYPLTVDPLVWIVQEVTAGDAARDDEFGNAVAISGRTALIGASRATVNGNEQQGAAYVFTESNGTWRQTAKLVASDGVTERRFRLLRCP